MLYSEESHQIHSLLERRMLKHACSWEAVCEGWVLPSVCEGWVLPSVLRSLTHLLLAKHFPDTMSSKFSLP